MQLRASRKLDTGDENDFVIPLDTPFELGLAINYNTNDFHLRHQYQESMIVILPSDGSQMLGASQYIALGISLLTLNTILC